MGLQHFWIWHIRSKYFIAFWRREKERPSLTNTVSMAPPVCCRVCGLDAVSGRSKSIWSPPKRVKEALCNQIWVSEMWRPAPVSLSLQLNPNGLLGLEANVKLILCSSHATRVHIVGTKSCLICWVYWIEFQSQHFRTLQEPAQPRSSFTCVLAAMFMLGLFLKETL